MIDRRQFEALFESQVSEIKQPALVACIREFQVEPRLKERDWDYGKPGEQFPCWICIEDASTNSGIAYCEQGFGPGYPWGLVFLQGEWASIGMDSQWHLALEDAVRNSQFWRGGNPPGYEVP